MLKQAGRHSTPEEFAEMIRRHLSQTLKIKMGRDGKDPLLLELELGGKGGGKSRISLHHAFRTYRNSGDWNTAVRYLNGIVDSAAACRNEREMAQIDLSCVYPALRAARFVEEAGKEADLIAEPGLPGLDKIYLELKPGFSKMMSRPLLGNQRHVTEEKLKEIASRNLQWKGWMRPNMTLSDTRRESCVFDVYLDPPYPVECQFLNSDLTKVHMPDTYLIAFPNRSTTLVMRSTEAMETAEAARESAKQAQFAALVRRSYSVMPHPVSDRMYWSHKGRIRLLPVG